MIEEDKKQTRIYSITAKKEELDILESLFKTMQSMGIAGASRAIKIFVDGDGAFHPRFKKLIIYESSSVFEEDIESIIPGNTDKKEITHGYGRIKKDCEEFNGDGWWVYYDFG